MHQLLDFLGQIAQQVPTSIFMFVGSIIEEIIAPIPSPFVSVTAGSISLAQHRPFVFLLLLAAIGTVAKTASGYLYYWLADIAEDFLTSRLGKFIGLSHKQIEGFGKYFNGTRRDEIVLIILRALPFMPSPPVSVFCGFIKLNIRSYLTATVIGSFFRTMFYLTVGYLGVENFSHLMNIFEITNTWLEYAIIGGVIVAAAFILIKKDRIKSPLEKWLEKILTKKVN